MNDTGENAHEYRIVYTPDGYLEYYVEGTLVAREKFDAEKDKELKIEWQKYQIHLALRPR